MTDKNGTSILASGGSRHFVSPKMSVVPNEPALNSPNVVLTANFTDQMGRSFDDLYWWDVNGESRGTDTCNISRAATGWYVVQIMSQNTGDPVAVINVWIVWANLASEVQGIAAFEENVNPANPMSVWKIQDGFPWRFKWTIEPSSIITEGDKPKLTGPPRWSPPGAGTDENLKKYLPNPSWNLADTAFAKWDVSRKMRVVIRNPESIPYEDQFAMALKDVIHDVAIGQPLPFAIAVDFPTDDAAGNDDPLIDGIFLDQGDPDHRGRGDEDDIPYIPFLPGTPHMLAHDIGELTSGDKPHFAVMQGWGTIFHAQSFNHDVEFREFCRLELWDRSREEETGKRFWFRISDEFAWHHAIRTTFDPNETKWINADSRSDEGSLYIGTPE